MLQFTLSGNAYFDTLPQPVLLVEQHQLRYFNRAAVRAFWPTPLQEDGPVPEALARESDGAVLIRDQDWVCQTQSLPEGTLYLLHRSQDSAAYAVLLNRLAGRNASHLQQLSNAIQTLEDHLVETERLRNQLELAQLRQAYARILRTDRNISYFCQMTPDEVDMNFPMQVLDLAGLCRDVYRQCEYLLELAGITLVYEEAVKSILVRGNETLLFHLLYNLLSNSAKSYRGKPGVITLRVALEGTNGVVTVEDSGCGIRPATLRTVFDLGENPSFLLPFALGLPLGRKIANYHGGALFLLPQKTGTQAVLSLPTTQGRFHRKQDPKRGEQLASLKIVDGTFHPALIGLSDVVPQTAFAGESDT